MFHGPDLDCAVDRFQVIDATRSCGFAARLREIRNRKRREHSDDGHNDHDFDQGESTPHECSAFHIAFRFGDVNEADGGLLIRTDFVHELPLPTAIGLNNTHRAKLREKM